MKNSQNWQRVAWVLLPCFLAYALPLTAAATTGISLSTNVDDMMPPATWYAMKPGTGSYYGKRSGWGFIELPPGTYEILIEPGQSGDGAIVYSTTTVSEGTSSVVVSTGLRLTSRAGLSPLTSWEVLGAGSDTGYFRVRERWGAVPVPAGRYRIAAPLETVLGDADNVEVTDGVVTDVDFSELGVSPVTVDDPRSQGISLAFGGDETEVAFRKGDSWYSLPSPTPGESKTTMWMKSEPLTFAYINGRFWHQIDIDPQPGEITHISFDAIEVAKQHSLGLIDFSETDFSSLDNLRLLDTAGGRLLRFQSAKPDADRWLTPAGTSLVGLRDGVLGQLAQAEGGEVTHATFDSHVTDNMKRGSRPSVEVVIQEPIDGAAFKQNVETVEVVGRASAVQAAGMTKVVLVIDTSKSVDDSVGKDIDGDGESDSILDAEVVAAQRMLEALVELDRNSFGSAFALSVVAFDEEARIIASLSSLDDESAVEALERNLKQLRATPGSGSTYYDHAFDAVLRIFEQSSTSGPRVVVLMTDGKPSSTNASISAAARLGASDVLLHAIGLGRDFLGTKATQSVEYPPAPKSGPALLQLLANLGKAGGKSWPLPSPADVVDIVAELPIVQPTDGGIGSIEVFNETTSTKAAQVDVSQDGGFRAQVPIELIGENFLAVNTLRVTAVNRAGDAQAVVKTRVQAEGGQAILRNLGNDVARLKGAIARLENELSKGRSELQAERNRADKLDELLESERSKTKDKLQDCAAKTKQCEAAKESLAEKQRSAFTIVSDSAKSLQMRLETEVSEVNSKLQACAAETRNCKKATESLATALLNLKKTPSGLRMRFRSDVLFDFGKSVLRSDAVEALRQAAIVISGTKKSNIVITGYTDSIGSEAENDRLSMKRAQAVASWLEVEASIPADQMEVHGLGERNPIAPNTIDGADNPEGRAQNRRVEIFLAQ